MSEPETPYIITMPEPEPASRILGDILIDKWVTPVWHTIAAANGHTSVEVDTAGCSGIALCRHRVRLTNGTIAVFTGDAVAEMFRVRGAVPLSHF